MITSCTDVKLTDGLYNLTAKVKNSNAFNQLEMYALSNGRLFKYSFKKENTSWQTITVKNIRISGGKVEVGFLADAQANASCFVDDVSLVKSKTAN